MIEIAYVNINIPENGCSGDIFDPAPAGPDIWEKITIVNKKAMGRG